MDTLQMALRVIPLAVLADMEVALSLTDTVVEVSHMEVVLDLDSMVVTMDINNNTMPSPKKSITSLKSIITTNLTQSLLTNPTT